MTMYHRTWFPFILIGLTLALLLVVVASVSSRPSGNVVYVSKDEVIAITDVDYEASVTNILETFYRTQDGKGFRDDLLAQRVPKEFLDLHFALILVADDILQGNQEQATVSLSSLRNDYPWLP